MQEARLPKHTATEEETVKALKRDGFNGGAKDCLFACLEGVPEAVKALLSAVVGTGADMVRDFKKAATRPDLRGGKSCPTTLHC
ncbi:MAG: hypothetical protein PHS57_04945 [Alphaproteobacteria bacterium]|nr:hypothetical protein [Alphaproteobacteria bacterium]